MLVVVHNRFAGSSPCAPGRRVDAREKCAPAQPSWERSSDDLLSERKSYCVDAREIPPNPESDNSARRAGLKPMERLSGGHELHAGVGERGGLRGTVHAGEVRVRAQILLAGLAHLLIGLDAENVVAIFEEKLAEEAGAGTDVSDDLAGEQAAFRAQKIEHRRRIAWAIANIVRRAIGEALFGVGKSHAGS